MLLMRWCTDMFQRTAIARRLRDLERSSRQNFNTADISCWSIPMTTSYWLLWTWVAGVVVLALVIAYGIRKAGRRSRQQRADSDSATNELYKQEDRASR
jgi:hypothetical protein